MLSTTVPFRIPPARPPFGRLVPAAFALLVAVVGAAEAAAGVAWHPDLAAARRASAVSQRPVLAIFTASWSSVSSTLDRTTLASDEAVALISACFEPVCVDVDTHAETTRRLGIQRVPTACVLTADEQPLSTFELPETPAEFVAAAARAAQEAATAAGRSPRGTTTEITSSRHAITDLTASGSSPLPDLAAPAQHQSRGSVAPGGQAITAVAAKVRRLSDFASDDVPASADSAAIAASFRGGAGEPKGALVPDTATLSPALTSDQASVSPTPTRADMADGLTSRFAAAPATPAPPATGVLGATDTLAAAPASQPETQSATRAAEPLAEIAVRAPLAIEPAASAVSSAAAQPAKSPPWLAGPAPTADRSTTGVPAQAQATPPSPAAPRAAVTPQAGLVAAAPQQAVPQTPTPGPASASQPSPQAAGAAATPLADTAPRKPEKPATSGSQAFIAALQKPFTLFTPKAKPTTVGDGPEVAAKARPANQAAAPTETVAGPTPSTEPDVYGSMPVGLEGYCPVTLTEKGTWVEGRAQWGVRHRGRTYLFAGAEQQKAFLADPDRYAPALSGDDPVLAFDTGKSTPGQRRYGVTYQSRMYLFSSTETRDAFAANPQRYTTGALVAENRVPTAGSVVR
ncbi:MAG: hypothetical protein RLZZ111_1306 [Planctomycetota bacterium]